MKQIRYDYELTEQLSYFARRSRNNTLRLVQRGAETEAVQPLEPPNSTAL